MAKTKQQTVKPPFSPVLKTNKQTLKQGFKCYQTLKNGLFRFILLSDVKASCFVLFCVLMFVASNFKNEFINQLNQKL